MFSTLFKIVFVETQSAREPPAGLGVVKPGGDVAAGALPPALALLAGAGEAHALPVWLATANSFLLLTGLKPLRLA